MSELIKICIDCKAEFKDPHDLFKKCAHCQERDIAYRERAEQERYTYGDDE